eukprot:210769-Prymnesium_polylepis.1
MASLASLSAGVPRLGLNGLSVEGNLFCPEQLSPRCETRQVRRRSCERASWPMAWCAVRRYRALRALCGALWHE